MQDEEGAVTEKDPFRDPPHCVLREGVHKPLKPTQSRLKQVIDRPKGSGTNKKSEKKDEIKFQDNNDEKNII